jgi:hypothetical protein
MRHTLFLGLAVLPALSTALEISKSSRCGAQFGLTCKGSGFGNCCSHANYCGSTAAYCGSGCQSAYGDCTGSTQPQQPQPQPPSNKKVSLDGTCAGKNGYTCLSSGFGNCCSQHGYCGRSKDYCGTGCNAAFGTCNGQSTTLRTETVTSTTSLSSTGTSSAAPPSSTQKVSTNGRCGNAYDALPLGMTCVGSKYGDCCSQYSYWYVLDSTICHDDVD